MDYVKACVENMIKSGEKAFEKKEKCDHCNRGCDGFCPKKCLNYYSETERPFYKCKYQRIAYIMRYFYAHRAEIRKLLCAETDGVVQHLNLRTRQSALKCAGYGSGPGTEVFGVIEWLYQCTDLKNLGLKFTAIDKQSKWRNQLSVIERFYAPMIESLGLKLSIGFKEGDISEIEISEVFDLATFSYSISEQRKPINLEIEEYFESLWDKFRPNLATNSIIILNDINLPNVNSALENIVDLVLDTYKASSVVRYCFKGDFGICHSDNSCGGVYKEEIRKKFKGKRWCGSNQCLIYVRKG